MLFNLMKISNKIIFENRSGANTSWFHPRATLINGEELFMTLQSIEGSDFYGPLHFTVSHDYGTSWSIPQIVPGMGRISIDKDFEEGICDAVPAFHAPTNTVLAIGHNVYYHNDKLFDSLADFSVPSASPTRRLQRYPVYSVMDRNYNWCTIRKSIEMPSADLMSIYSCGSSQRLFVEKDKLLIPLTFGYWGQRDRMFQSILTQYDGKTISFFKQGNILRLPQGRGLLEPSLCFYGDRYLVTLRTEDGFGYFAESADGLEWENLRRWQFDNGEYLKMLSTQQHWLVHKDNLFLVYNRKTSTNHSIFRWRAPLFIAEINTVQMKIVKSTERILFPMLIEGNNAAGMGNFHPLAISRDLSIVTVGEERSFDNYNGNTIIAFIS